MQINIAIEDKRLKNLLIKKFKKFKSSINNKILITDNPSLIKNSNKKIILISKKEYKYDDLLKTFTYTSPETINEL